MLSRNFIRATRTPYSLRVAGTRFYNRPQKGDPGDEAHKAGLAARDASKATPSDAASPQTGKQASRDGLSGNKEKIGFADQVGSQSDSGRKDSGGSLKGQKSEEGHTGEEGITPPSFVDVVKKKMGLGTTSGEDKQNRGGGKGVTGTGTFGFDTGKRTLHTSAVWMIANTRGQAPEASRQPHDVTNGDQNAHLKHRDANSGPDTGKGNAGENPSLPSQHRDRSSPSPSAHQQYDQSRRGFSTSTRVAQENQADGENGETEHTAESYFKEVDETEPVNPKVHQVDTGTSGAPVARANEKPATGEFSRAGSQTGEYDATSKHDKPYDMKPTQGPGSDRKGRYGGVFEMDAPSRKGEGPEGESKGGRR